MCISLVKRGVAGARQISGLSSPVGTGVGCRHPRTDVLGNFSRPHSTSSGQALRAEAMLSPYPSRMAARLFLELLSTECRLFLFTSSGWTLLPCGYVMGVHGALVAGIPGLKSETWGTLRVFPTRRVQAIMYRPTKVGPSGVVPFQRVHSVIYRRAVQKLEEDFANSRWEVVLS